MTSLRNPTNPRNQQGAVLFISLILLVVLSLIGIASMQVTTLQEHMAGNYYTQSRAFEYSEWMVRTQESAIYSAYAAGNAFVSNDESCQATYNGAGSVDAWANNKTATAVGGTNAGNMVAGSWYTRRIDKCTPGQGSLKTGQPINNNTTAIYQVLGVDNDAPVMGGQASGGPVDNTSASSLAVVSTIYIP